MVVFCDIPTLAGHTRREQCEALVEIYLLSYIKVQAVISTCTDIYTPSVIDRIFEYSVVTEVAFVSVTTGLINHIKPT
jgi:hypothetical protein